MATERLRVLAEQRTKIIQKRTLTECLRQQVEEKEARKAKARYDMRNSSLDAPFKEEGVRPEILRQSKNLANDLKNQTEAKMDLARSTGMLQAREKAVFTDFCDNLNQTVTMEEARRKAHDSKIVKRVWSHQQQRRQMAMSANMIVSDL